MKENYSNKVIVVLGAGRCGTSLAMQVLEKLGLTLSHNLIPAKAHNIQGPKEDVDIAKVYDDFLFQIGSTRTLPLSIDDIPDYIINETISKLVNITKKNIIDSKSIWGFKDPFTSCVLPLWFRVFNITNTLPVFILTVRNPGESTISRKKHFGILESLGELAWLVNYTEALHHTAAQCYIVHYEEWFLRGDELAEELMDYTRLNMYFAGKYVSTALRGLIKKNLNRSIYEDYEVKNEYVIRLYEILKNCKGREFDRNTLMQTVKECRKAIRGFRGWYKEAQKHILLEDNLSKRVKEKDNEIQNELEKMVLENNHLLKEQKDLFEENQELRKHLSTLKQKLEQELDQVQSQNQDLKVEIKRANRRNASIDRKIMKWRREVIELRQSYSYRFGQIFINAIRRPGKNTLLIPYYLVVLTWDMVSGQGRKKVKAIIDRVS